jgi:hypothetical protein
MLYPFIVFTRPLHLDTSCWLTYLESSTLRISWASIGDDNFKKNTSSGRYGATYNMVASLCFNEELLLLPKNPTEAKLQATSTRGESTEPT